MSVIHDLIDRFEELLDHFKRASGHPGADPVAEAKASAADVEAEAKTMDGKQGSE